MTVEPGDSNFRLIFEGPADDSAETLRRIKGVFLIDLSLSVDQAQQILSQAPSVIMSIANAQDAERFRKLLSKAGAKVLLVKPASTEEDESSAGEMEFTLDDPSAFEDAELPEPNVYELPLDQDEDLEAILASTENIQPPDAMNTAPAVEEPPTIAAPALAEPDPVPADLSNVDNLLAVSKTESSSPHVTPPLSQSEQDGLLFDAPAATPVPTAAVEPTPATPAAPTFEADGLSFDEPASPPPAKTSPPPAPEPPPSPDASLNFDDLKPLPAEPETYKPVVVPRVSDELDLTISPLDELRAQGKAAAAKASAASDPSPQPPPAPAAPTQAAPSLTEPLKVEAPPLPPPALEVSMTPALEPQPVTATPAAAPAPVETPLPTPTPAADPVKVPTAAAARKRTRGKNLPMDVILPTVLGALLLGAGNWWYFSSTPMPQIDSTQILKLVPPAVSKVEPVENDPAKKGLKETAPIIYSIHDEQNKISFSGELALTNVRMLTFSINFSTPKPPPLSNDEIVKRVVRDPWAYRGELTELEFTLQDDGRWEGIGSAKIYLEYKGARTRIAVPAKVLVKGGAGADEIKLDIEAVTPESKLPANQNFRVGALPEGGFSAALKYQLKGALTIESEPAPAPVEPQPKAKKEE